MKHFTKIFLLISFVTIVILYSLISNSQSENFFTKAKNNNSSATKTDDFDHDGFVKNIVGIIKKDYVEEKTNEQLEQAAATGILSSLDPHSSYLTEDDLKEMEVQTKGEFGGIGIEVTMEYSLIKVISAIEDTPGYKAGIKSGDYISKIDGKSVVGTSLNDMVKKLRGKQGSKVVLTILRNGEKNPIDLIIYREIIKIKAVKSNRFGDIAYIKINSFSSQASNGVVSELNKLIDALGKNNIKGLVLDLRNDPGGLLEEAIAVSDLFLNKNQTIVSIRGRNKADDKYFSDEAEQKLIPNIPMAVLINEGSASASEIVAGALQDNKRAVIIGTKSFGKGSVQSVISLGNKMGGIKMTTALYYTPSNKSIQAEGIEPDIIVSDAKLLDKPDKKDEQLNSEASLDGHLREQINESLKENSKPQLNDDNLELYNQDYQLARAIDLLRGISIYEEIK